MSTLYTPFYLTSLKDSLMGALQNIKVKNKTLRKNNHYLLCSYPMVIGSHMQKLKKWKKSQPKLNLSVEIVWCHTSFWNIPLFILVVN